MKSSAFKIVIKIGLLTAVVIILFQVSTLLFEYRYFKFDYYISGVALFFLMAGYAISRYKQPAKPEANIDTDPFADLTIKELHILRLIVQGKSNKEIAALNYVEVSTIKTHINNIYTKLALSNRKEAINRYKTWLNSSQNSKIHPLST